MTIGDSELLEQFVRTRSEEAFNSIVRGHIDLVYSTALRLVRSPQLAEDVAQSVFLDLSRSADKLKSDTILTAWLYRVTHRTAIDTIRTESRRQQREQIAVELADMKSPDPQWYEIEPLLEDAMQSLNEQDRASILLRYFQNKSLREVGQALGTSDDTAQKRVSRAVDRLREFFSKKGVTIGSTGFIVLLSTNAVQSAPAGLSSAIVSSGLAVALKASGTVTVKTLAMTTTQKILVSTALAAAIGTGVYEWTQNNALQAELRQWQSKFQPLVDANDQLRRDQQDWQKHLLAAQQEAEQARRQITELAKLRGDVARLRESERELTAKLNDTGGEMKSWLDRVDVLKKRLAEKPEYNIPELQLATERDWLDAAHDKLDTEKDVRSALSRLRRIVEGKFAGRLVKILKQYMEANHGNYPATIADLQAFCQSPIDIAAFERYEIVTPKTLASGKVTGEWIVTQKAAVDDEFDGRNSVGPDNWGSSYPAWKKRNAGGSDWDKLAPLMDAYKTVYGIREPSDYELLKPFAKTPEQQLALERVIADRKDEK